MIYEKNWTKNLKTDDQTVLRTAKEAQEMENKALSRFEEVQLTGITTVGVSQTDTGTECASVEEDENKEKVWTITAFGEDGIVSTRCQNGKIIDSWEIKYTNPNDAKKVQDFICRFEKDANLIFSGSKDFWEEFLSSDMDADSIFAAHHISRYSQTWQRAWRHHLRSDSYAEDNPIYIMKGLDANGIVYEQEVDSNGNE